MPLSELINSNRHFLIPYSHSFCACLRRKHFLPQPSPEFCYQACSGRKVGYFSTLNPFMAFTLMVSRFIADLLYFGTLHGNAAGLFTVKKLIVDGKINLKSWHAIPMDKTHYEWDFSSFDFLPNWLNTVWVRIFSILPESKPRHPNIILFLIFDDNVFNERLFWFHLVSE